MLLLLVLPVHPRQRRSPVLNRQPSQKIRPDHLDRLAIIYVRQSTLFQVRENSGSTTKIEEIYSLALKIEIRANETVSLMHKAKQIKEYHYDPYSVRYDEIKPSLNRIKMLVRLYLPQISDMAQKFIDDLTQLCDPVYHSLYITSTGESDQEEEVKIKFGKASHNFAKSYVDLLFALEKLVR
jgi:hypothetical protein